MTLPRRIFFVLLGFSLLLGQLPYRSLYCGMMKRSIDTQMMQCCMKHRAVEERELVHRFTSAGMMQVHAKPTLGDFDRYRSENTFSSHIFFTDCFAAVDPMLLIEQPVTQDAEHLPPDLTILNLNLRI
ncbi:MAG: hypothetical protein HY033_06540 [Ignavibacteriae bacterium]|nr:hypothetical protein [Ignavibacteria bacterium]MBI3364549.1 hypothetical protein [Ignavibacteriota bacterium]